MKLLGSRGCQALSQGCCDIRGKETHYQEMVVVREKEGWHARSCQESLGVVNRSLRNEEVRNVCHPTSPCKFEKRSLSNFITIMVRAN